MAARRHHLSDAKLDPGVFTPDEPSRTNAPRGLLARNAWRFPAAFEEMRLWARPRSAPGADPSHAFYRPDEFVDESGDGGPVEPPRGRFLPPH